MYRKELNQIMMQRIREGRNGIQRDKYLTIAVHAADVKKAAAVYHRLDQDIDKTLGRFGSGAVPVPLEELLDILYGIYNDPREHLIRKSRVLNEEGKLVEIRSFDFDRMRSMGLIVNDVIGPSSMEIKRNHLRLGKKYVRTLRVSRLANKMSDEFLTTVTDMGFNCLTTINLKPIPPKKADAIVAQNLSFVRDVKTKQMRAGQKAGVYDDSYVSPEILDREAEALALRDSIRGKDERLLLFVTTIPKRWQKQRYPQHVPSFEEEYYTPKWDSLHAGVLSSGRSILSDKLPSDGHTIPARYRVSHQNGRKRQWNPLHGKSRTSSAYLFPAKARDPWPQHSPLSKDSLPTSYE